MASIGMHQGEDGRLCVDYIGLHDKPENPIRASIGCNEKTLVYKQNGMEVVLFFKSVADRDAYIVGLYEQLSEPPDDMPKGMEEG